MNKGLHTREVPYSLVTKYLNDALRCASVPTVGQRRCLPLTANHALQLFAQLVSILAHKDVGTLLDGLNVLGIGVERDAGNLIECSLLSNVSRIGNNAPGMSSEIAKVKVSERRCKMDDG